MTREMRPPIGIIYGGIGFGKTNAVAEAFPNYKWLITRRGALDGFYKRFPNVEIDSEVLLTHEFNEQTGDIKKISTLKSFKHKLNEFQRSDYPGLVLDEGSALFRRMADNIKKANGGTSFRVFDIIKEEIIDILGKFQVMQRGLIIVMHKNESKFYEEGAKKGDLQYAAGPNFPVGKLINEFTADLDLCWEYVIESRDDEIVERALLTQPGDDGLVMRKTACDFGIEPKEILKEGNSLRDILLRNQNYLIGD